MAPLVMSSVAAVASEDTTITIEAIPAVFAFNLALVGPLRVSGAYNVCVVTHEVAENIFRGELRDIDQSGAFFFLHCG